MQEYTFVAYDMSDDMSPNFGVDTIDVNDLPGREHLKHKRPVFEWDSVEDAVAKRQKPLEIEPPPRSSWIGEEHFGPGNTVKSQGKYSVDESKFDVDPSESNPGPDPDGIAERRIISTALNVISRRHDMNVESAMKIVDRTVRGRELKKADFLFAKQVADTYKEVGHSRYFDFRFLASKLVGGPASRAYYHMLIGQSRKINQRARAKQDKEEYNLRRRLDQL